MLGVLERGQTLLRIPGSHILPPAVKHGLTGQTKVLGWAADNLADRDDMPAEAFHFRHQKFPLGVLMSP